MKRDPLIFGGGPSVWNSPEPVALLFDAILLGDGEEALRGDASENFQA